MSRRTCKVVLRGEMYGTTPHTNDRRHVLLCFGYKQQWLLNWLQFIYDDDRDHRRRESCHILHDSRRLHVAFWKSHRVGISRPSPRCSEAEIGPLCEDSRRIQHVPEISSTYVQAWVGTPVQRGCPPRFELGQHCYLAWC